jgi:hypothetical protein
MANEPFITLLIKGQSDQISKIREAFVGINVDGKEVIRFGNLVEWPSDEELEKIPIDEPTEISKHEIGELRKLKWLYKEWGVLFEKQVYEIVTSENYLLIEYRELYAAPIKLIEDISKRYPDLFFFLAEYDIFNPISYNFFGMGGILHQYSMPPMEFDIDQRPIEYNSINQLVYMATKQGVPTDMRHGYNHWNPIHYLVYSILIEPERWNTTEPPKYDHELEDKKIAEYFERSIPDEDEEVDEDLNLLFGE